jgi:hypothetical protein
MTLDAFSVSAVTALVVFVCGVTFIAETLLRRDEGAGRIWAVAFLCAIGTTLSYMVWTLEPSTWWAVAVGNGLFVAGTGCMWLGCRRFNDRRLVWAAVLVLAGAAGAALAAIAEGPEGGAWAGALWMFVALLAFAATGAIEAMRPGMGLVRTAWGLAFVLGLQALFYVSRITAFAVSGPDSALFRTWFGTTTASLLTVVLTIVAVIVVSVLRAARAPLRGFETEDPDAGDEIRALDEFRAALSGLCTRGSWRSDLIGVIAVRIEDLDQISTAFGSEVARAVRDTWRAGVRRHAPAEAFVGEDDGAGLLVGARFESPTDARRQAARIYRGVFEDLGGVTGGVIPMVGVGVALSDPVGYTPAHLVVVARDAARRAATSMESSVVVGDAGEGSQFDVSR